MLEKTYYIWTKFNNYTGNFEREFAAYMMGYEDEYSEGDYKFYVDDFENNAESLFSLRDKLKFIVQEVDDSHLETCYNIDPFPFDDSKNCNAVFFQFREKPTREELEIFKIRANGFVSFYNAIEKQYGDKTLTVEEIKASVSEISQEKIY